MAWPRRLAGAAPLRESYRHSKQDASGASGGGLTSAQEMSSASTKAGVGAAAAAASGRRRRTRRKAGTLPPRALASVLAVVLALTAGLGLCSAEEEDVRRHGFGDAFDNDGLMSFYGLGLSTLEETFSSPPPGPSPPPPSPR